MARAGVEPVHLAEVLEAFGPKEQRICENSMIHPTVTSVLSALVAQVRRQNEVINSLVANAQRGMQAAFEDLNAFLDALMVDHDLLPEQVVLFGFSQGTMMSLHIAPRREDPFAGVVGFSGRLVEPELLIDDVLSRPPVLLIHGDQDEVVPVQSLPEAAEALQSAGFKDVFAHIQKGTGHGIAPDGLSVALAFMRDKLGL